MDRSLSKRYEKYDQYMPPAEGHQFPCMGGLNQLLVTDLGRGDATNSLTFNGRYLLNDYPKLDLVEISSYDYNRLSLDKKAERVAKLLGVDYKNKEQRQQFLYFLSEYSQNLSYTITHELTSRLNKSSLTKYMVITPSRNVDFRRDESGAFSVIVKASGVVIADALNAESMPPIESEFVAEIAFDSTVNLFKVTAIELPDDEGVQKILQGLLDDQDTPRLESELDIANSLTPILTNFSEQHLPIILRQSKSIEQKLSDVYHQLQMRVEEIVACIQKFKQEGVVISDKPTVMKKVGSACVKVVLDTVFSLQAYALLFDGAEQYENMLKLLAEQIMQLFSGLSFDRKNVWDDISVAQLMHGSLHEILVKARRCGTHDELVTVKKQMDAYCTQNGTISENVRKNYLDPIKNHLAWLAVIHDEGNIDLEVDLTPLVVHDPFAMSVDQVKKVEERLSHDETVAFALASSTTTLAGLRNVELNDLLSELDEGAVQDEFCRGCDAAGHGDYAFSPKLVSILAQWWGAQNRLHEFLETNEKTLSDDLVKILKTLKLSDNKTVSSLEDNLDEYFQSEDMLLAELKTILHDCRVITIEDLCTALSSLEIKSKSLQVATINMLKQQPNIANPDDFKGGFSVFCVSKLPFFFSTILNAEMRAEDPSDRQALSIDSDRATPYSCRSLENGGVEFFRQVPVYSSDVADITKKEIGVMYMSFDTSPRDNKVSPHKISMTFTDPLFIADLKKRVSGKPGLTVRTDRIHVRQYGVSNPELIPRSLSTKVVDVARELNNELTQYLSRPHLTWRNYFKKGEGRGINAARRERAKLLQALAKACMEQFINGQLSEADAEAFLQVFHEFAAQHSEDHNRLFNRTNRFGKCVSDALASANLSAEQARAYTKKGAKQHWFSPTGGLYVAKALKAKEVGVTELRDGEEARLSTSVYQPVNERSIYEDIATRHIRVGSELVDALNHELKSLARSDPDQSMSNCQKLSSCLDQISREKSFLIDEQSLNVFRNSISSLFHNHVNRSNYSHKTNMELKIESEKKHDDAVGNIARTSTSFANMPCFAAYEERHRELQNTSLDMRQNNLLFSAISGFVNSHKIGKMNPISITANQLLAWLEDVVLSGCGNAFFKSIMIAKGEQWSFDSKDGENVVSPRMIWDEKNNRIEFIASQKGWDIHDPLRQVILNTRVILDSEDGRLVTNVETSLEHNQSDDFFGSMLPAGTELDENLRYLPGASLYMNNSWDKQPKIDSLLYVDNLLNRISEIVFKETIFQFFEDKVMQVYEVFKHQNELLAPSKVEQFKDKLFKVMVAKRTRLLSLRVNETSPDEIKLIDRQLKGLKQLSNKISFEKSVKFSNQIDSALQFCQYLDKEIGLSLSNVTNLVECSSGVLKELLQFAQGGLSALPTYKFNLEFSKAEIALRINKVTSLQLINAKIGLLKKMGEAVFSSDFDFDFARFDNQAVFLENLCKQISPNEYAKFALHIQNASMLYSEIAGFNQFLNDKKLSGDAVKTLRACMQEIVAKLSAGKFLDYEEVSISLRKQIANYIKGLSQKYYADLGKIASAVFSGDANYNEISVNFVELVESSKTSLPDVKAAELEDYIKHTSMLLSCIESVNRTINERGLSDDESVKDLKQFMHDTVNKLAEGELVYFEVVIGSIKEKAALLLQQLAEAEPAEEAAEAAEEAAEEAVAEEAAEPASEPARPARPAEPAEAETHETQYEYELRLPNQIEAQIKDIKSLINDSVDVDQFAEVCTSFMVLMQNFNELVELNKGKIDPNSDVFQKVIDFCNQNVLALKRAFNLKRYFLLVSAPIDKLLCSELKKGYSDLLTRTGDYPSDDFGRPIDLMSSDTATPEEKIEAAVELFMNIAGQEIALRTENNDIMHFVERDLLKLFKPLERILEEKARCAQKNFLEGHFDKISRAYNELRANLVNKLSSSTSVNSEISADLIRLRDGYADLCKFAICGNGLSDSFAMQVNKALTEVSRPAATTKITPPPSPPRPSSTSALTAPGSPAIFVPHESAMTVDDNRTNEDQEALKHN